MREVDESLEDSGLKFPRFAAAEKVCGACILYIPHSHDDVRGWLGVCRFQRSRGLFPPEAPLCDKFTPRTHRDERTTLPESKGDSASMSRRIAPRVRGSAPETVEQQEEQTMNREDLVNLLQEALGVADVPLASRWAGGKLVITPGREGQAKELSVDVLFHKVVMIRDRLRAMEQKVNAHPKLSDAEKVELQQYVTRCYGSLTSFNFLFRDREDQFIGEQQNKEGR